MCTWGHAYECSRRDACKIICVCPCMDWYEPGRALHRVADKWFAEKSSSYEKLYHPCKFEQYSVLYVRMHMWIKVCMNTYKTTDLYWGVYHKYYAFLPYTVGCGSHSQVAHTGTKFKIDGHGNFAIWGFCYCNDNLYIRLFTLTLDNFEK